MNFACSPFLVVQISYGHTAWILVLSIGPSDTPTSDHLLQFSKKNYRLLNSQVFLTNLLPPQFLFRSKQSENPSCWHRKIFNSGFWYFHSWIKIVVAGTIWRQNRIICPRFLVDWFFKGSWLGDFEVIWCKHMSTRGICLFNYLAMNEARHRKIYILFFNIRSTNG